MSQSLDKTSSDSPSVSKSHNIIKILGTGGFGKVYLCEKKDLSKIALKRIRCKTLEEANQALQEFSIGKSLKHENIAIYFDCRLYTDFQDDDFFINIEMQYYEEGDLYDYILHRNRPTLSESDILHLAGQILNGLEYMHEKGLLHRDLKPKNILMYQFGKKVAISDFGNSKVKEGTMNNSISGTMEYIAIESVMERKYDYSSDIFSFGAILYFMLTRKERIMYLQIFTEKNFYQNLMDEIRNVRKCEH